MLAKRIIETARALAQATVTSVRLVEESLERADDPAGEGARVFTRIYREAARVQAAASDHLRGAGIVASPLSGIPISIKDLFDVAGETLPPARWFSRGARRPRAMPPSCAGCVRRAQLSSERPT
jgi:Asp-tRNA(Asn)/Glu-tRNA(Gln) amidotransferase A subunit family amidase